MTCPDRCPNPDQTLRDDITHAALSVGTGGHAEYQALLKSSDGPLWERSCTKDIARLAQGFPPGGIPASEGTDTIRFIKVSDIPEGRKATYVNICSPDRPQQEQQRRVRFTVGGDRPCDGVRRHLRERLIRCLVVSAALCVASVTFN